MTKIVVCTSSRPINYIHQLFNTIRENINIHLFVSGKENGYLQKYISNPNVLITTRPISSTNIIFRQFINYKYCLSEGYIVGEDGILIVEDDVKFALGWKKRLEEIISALKLKHEDNFALSLFTSTTICRNDNLPLCHYALFSNIDRFIGSQGMYYPNAVRKKILLQFNRINETNVTNYDTLLARILQDENIPLYVAIPCLIEHVGVKSTWSNNLFTMAATIFHPVLTS